MHQSRRTVARGPCRSCRRATCASAVCALARSGASFHLPGLRCQGVLAAPACFAGHRSWEKLPRHYFSSAVASPEAAICAHELPDLNFFAFLLGEHVRVLGSRVPQASVGTFDASFEPGINRWRVFSQHRGVLPNTPPLAVREPRGGDRRGRRGDLDGGGVARTLPAAYISCGVN